MSDDDRSSKELRNVRNYRDAKAAFNEHNLEACLAFYATDHQVHSQAAESGAIHIKHFLRAMHIDWPDIKIEVERIVAEGDWLAAWCTATATHAKLVWGVPPTHRMITTTFWEFHRFNDLGVIAETWNLIDSLTILQQLGLVPAR